MRNLFLGTAFVLIVLVPGSWLCQSWDDDLALALWDLSLLAGGLESDRTFTRDLDARGEAMFRYTQAKMRAIDEVINGRRSLPEAAEELWRLARTKPGFDERFEQVNRPGDSLAERYGREVIDWARAILRAQPDQARAVTRRLETELDDWLRCGTPGPPW